jgi:hypothetical protein
VPLDDDLVHPASRLVCTDQQQIGPQRNVLPLMTCLFPHASRGSVPAVVSAVFNGLHLTGCAISRVRRAVRALSTDFRWTARSGSSSASSVVLTGLNRRQWQVPGASLSPQDRNLCRLESGDESHRRKYVKLQVWTRPRRSCRFSIQQTIYARSGRLASRRCLSTSGLSDRRHRL